MAHSPDSPDRPRVVFVDDGELADVRALLDSLGVGYGAARNHEEFSATDGCDLLISSARHALATPVRSADVPPPLPCRLHLVVYDAISEGLRRILSLAGCDVAVGRPVHAAVLRLLVAHAFYAGPERRERGRVAMSVPVRVSNSNRNSVATLVQMSGRGCGLVATERAEVGDRVELSLPPEFTAGGPFCVPASVIDVQPGEDGAYSLALVFEAIDAALATALEEVMARHSLGVTSNQQVSQSDGPDEADRPAGRIRCGPRKLFAGRVVVAGSGEPRMMIGRDLSIGGMRVRPVPGLQVGDSLKLALYGGDDSAAIVIEAMVSRDDGWDGLALRFMHVAAELRSRLEELVGSLPATRSPQAPTSRTPGVLVSEILETS